MADGDGPFHDGERAIHRRLGLSDKLNAMGSRLVRDYMPDQHREFFAQLPFLLLGSMDGSGGLWASVVTGAPGFVSSPDPRTLRVDSPIADGDPASANLAAGHAVGILGIEPPTRRRNRMNGHVVTRGDASLEVSVDQSFGNCPKYIQARDWQWRAGEPEAVAGSFERPSALGSDEHRFIRAADTFFIASAYRSDDGAAAHGIDVSHRGGPPGFVAVLDSGKLVVPDYVGNFLFNTFGNIVANPRAGLLFVDFENGDLLQLSGRAEIAWNGEYGPGLPEETRLGAQRFLLFEPLSAVRARGAMPLAWTFREYSPHLPA